MDAKWIAVNQFGNVILVMKYLNIDIVMVKQTVLMAQMKLIASPDVAIF